MKKHIKLLLLGGIFTLIGIFNFSSAYILSDSYEVSINGGQTHAVSVPSNSLGIVVLSNSCSHIQGQNNIYDTVQSFSTDIGEYQNFSSSSVSHINVWDKSLTCSALIKFFYPDPPIIEGGTSTFTPIITGLTNSVNEFIPYVAYIGIGLLTAVIGFVAIKRLINWVRAKIFSSFKR